MMAPSLQAQIDKRQQQIDGLRKTRDDRRQSIANLESERRKWLIAARVDNNPKAQTEIEKLRDQIAAERSDDELDYAALTEMEADLEAQKGALRLDQRRSQHEKVWAMVATCADGKLEKKLIRLAVEIVETEEQIAAADREISGALYSLGPAFYEEGRKFGYRCTHRRNALNSLLRNVADTHATSLHFDPEKLPESVAAAMSRLMQSIRDAAGADLEPTPEGGQGERGSNPRATIVGDPSDAKLPNLEGRSVTVVGQ